MTVSNPAFNWMQIAPSIQGLKPVNAKLKSLCADTGAVVSAAVVKRVDGVQQAFVVCGQ